MAPLKNIAGIRYGRLVPMHMQGKYTSKGGSTATLWLCRCDCGNELTVPHGRLTSGNTTSCGCYIKEIRHRNCAVTDASLNGLISSYKWRARRKNIPYMLTRDQFKTLTSSICFYCGDLPKHLYKSRNNTGDYKYNGLDRVDPNSGYTIDNVVPCCKKCNEAKMDLSIKDFYDWIDRVYARRFTCIERFKDQNISNLQ